MRSSKKLLYVVLLLVILSSGCRPNQPAQTTLTPTVEIATDGGPSTDEGICESEIYGSIFVWHDTDGNGIYNTNEKPFYRIHVGIGELETYTDENGKAEFNVFGMGCCGPCEGSIVFAEAPIGYKASTPAEIAQTYNGAYSFGLMDDPAGQTPTPYVAKLACEHYDIHAQNMALTSDDALWVGLDDGAAQYDPKTNQFIAHHQKLKFFDQLAAGVGGVVWLQGIGMNAIRYHHAKWTEYSKNSLVAHSSLSIEAMPGQKIWFPIWADQYASTGIYAAYSQIASFDPASKQWKLYRAPKDTNTLPEKIRVLTDGAIWFAALNEDTTATLPKNNRDTHWTIYDTHEFSKNEIVDLPDLEMITDSKVTKDGTLWMATMNGILKYNPETNQQKTFPWPNGITYESFIMSPRMAIAPDGSIWLTTSSKFRPLLLQLSIYADETVWSSYDERDGIPVLDGGLVDASRGFDEIAMTGDGKLWLGGLLPKFVLGCKVLK